MSRSMVNEAGTRMFEMATSLGRMHVSTLNGLANATAKTPFGPMFAVNASVARMMHEGMESLGDRMLNQQSAMGSVEMPIPPMPPVVADPAPAVAAAVAPLMAGDEVAAPKPKKTKPVKAKKDDATEKAETAVALAIEPEAEDVLADPVDTPFEVNKGEADDLTRINGIGATTAKKLKTVGVERFSDIAKMEEKQFSDLLASLNIRSIRFTPTYWIEEAKKYAVAPT